MRNINLDLFRGDIISFCQQRLQRRYREFKAGQIIQLKMKLSIGEYIRKFSREKNWI